jgi:3-phenylpropionate/cinnamic acid dioxygenase small subunit
MVRRTPSTSPCKSSDPFASRPLFVGSSVGYEIQEFLAWEALLLDNHRYIEWRDLLAANLEYHCPGLPDDERSYNFTLWHLRRQPSSTAPEALAHTRRVVSNVIVIAGDSPMEFAVASYVMVNYSSPGELHMSAFTVGRRDYLRRTNSNSFLILRREIRMGRISPQTRELVGPL